MASEKGEEKILDKEEEKILRGFDFYHGFLPREELGGLLRNEGDYLIRVSEVDQKEKDTKEVKMTREIILSIKATQEPGVPESLMQSIDSKEPEPNKPSIKLKNLIIRRKDGKYLIEQTRGFPNIKELVDYYRDNVGQINTTSFQLKKGILRQSWEFQHSDVELGKLLGQGAFGEVRGGTLKRKGKILDVAVKLTKSVGDLGKAKIKEMMKEARIMRDLSHKNVVRLYGVAVDEQPLYIILELVKGGALNAYLTANAGQIGLSEKISMCLGAAMGVEYLHRKKCIHMDLAARNCLYTDKKVVKISDFGLSRTGVTVYALKPGAPSKFPIKWLAPETIETLTFSTKTDVYSYGVILFEIFSDGKEPWEESTNAEVKKSLLEGRMLAMPPECPDRINSFVKESIFVKDPTKRCTMADITAFFEKKSDSEPSMYSSTDGKEKTGGKDEKTGDASRKDEKSKMKSLMQDVTVETPKKDCDKKSDEKENSGKRFKKKKGFHARHVNSSHSNRKRQQ